MYRDNRRNSESDVKTDRYFITYADIITLLLGLFVILYASSKVDEEKYKEFSQAFNKYFQTGNGVLEGGKGVLEGSTLAEKNPFISSNKSLDEIFEQTTNAFMEYIKSGQLDIRKLEGRVILSLPEKLLFESGKANIEKGAYGLIDTLGNILNGIKYQVSVDGHTDSKPIRTFQFESNWHLSVARALNVGFELMQKGLPQTSLVIRGFGSQRPIAENSTESGREKNRRVEIQISKLSAESPSTEGYLKKVDIK